MRTAVTATPTVTGISSPFVFQGSFRTTFPLIRRCGFRNVELHLRDSSLIDQQNLHQLLDENGLHVSSIGTGEAYSIDHLSLSNDDSQIRALAVERVKGHILHAATYPHAVVIIGLLRGNIRDCTSKVSFERHLLTSMEQCVETAAEHQVTLVIELINRYETDYLNTVQEGLEFLKRIPSPFLKLHLDTFHMNIEESNIEDSVLQAGKEIGHVHVADSDRWYVGHGHFPFIPFIDALEKTGYTETLSLECISKPDPCICATQSAHNLMVLLNRLGKN